jgi:hypothetical protein
MTATPNGFPVRTVMNRWSTALPLTSARPIVLVLELVQ